VQGRSLAYKYEHNKRIKGGGGERTNERTKEYQREKKKHGDAKEKRKGKTGEREDEQTERKPENEQRIPGGEKTRGTNKENTGEGHKK
jgi:hypothetical protein